MACDDDVMELDFGTFFQLTSGARWYNSLFQIKFVRFHQYSAYQDLAGSLEALSKINNQVTGTIPSELGRLRALALVNLDLFGSTS